MKFVPIYGLQLVFANLAIAVYLYMMIGSVSEWLAYSAVMRLSVVITHVLAAVLIYSISLYLAGLRFAQFRGQMKE